MQGALQLHWAALSQFPKLTRPKAICPTAQPRAPSLRIPIAEAMLLTKQSVPSRYFLNSQALLTLTTSASKIVRLSSFTLLRPRMEVCLAVRKLAVAVVRSKGAKSAKGAKSGRSPTVDSDAES